MLLAVPAWNEQETIADVVGDLQAQIPGATVIVIDDGSSDDTPLVAGAAGAEVVQLPFNVGVGGAMRTAFLFAQREGFSRVVQIDGDGQHDPKYVSDLLAALDGADVVVGSRFAGVGDYRMRGPRRWASAMLSRALSRVVGAKLTDATSGFRAAGPRAIPLFARHYPAEYLGDTVDSLVLAARAGLTVAEVPVSMRPRQGGEPSQSPIRAGMYLGRSLLALFVALTRRSAVTEAEV